MLDYRTVSDSALMDLHEQSGSASESAAVEAELSRRAILVCECLEEQCALQGRLENWSLRAPSDLDGAIRLVGCVYGHRSFADGSRIVTSPLEVIVRTASADLAVTASGLYELSAVHPDLIRMLLE